MKKLKRRYNALQTNNVNIFFIKLRRFYEFIENDEILFSIMKSFKSKNPSSQFCANDLRCNDFQISYIKTENDLIYTSFTFIFNIISCLDLKQKDYWQAREEFDFYTKHLCDQEHEIYLEQINSFINFYAKAILEFYIEALEETKTILNITQKFRRKIEWFRKEEFEQIFIQYKSKAEEKLSLKYYEYLYDEGISFYIEPKTESGRVDLVISKKKGEKIIADAKIYDGQARNKAYIIKGTNQLLTYIKEENQRFGFLIIFETTDKRLFFNTKKQESGFPYIVIDNKQIFFITVNICSSIPSASKRGRMKKEDISENDF